MTTHKLNLLTGGEVSQFYSMISDMVNILQVNCEESLLTVYFECDSEVLEDIKDCDFEGSFEQITK